MAPFTLSLSLSRLRREYRDIKNKTAQQAIPPTKSKISTAAKKGLRIKCASMGLFAPVGISLKFASLCCRKFNSIILRSTTLFLNFAKAKLRTKALRRNSKDFTNVKTHRFNIRYAQQAFTMAEAVLVMTILGIIATVMITTMKPAQFKERALKVKTTKVINDLDQATEFITMHHSKDGTIEHLVAEDGSEFSVCSAADYANSHKLGALYRKYLQTSRKECADETCTCYKKANATRTTGDFMYLKDGSCVNIYTNPKANRQASFPNETKIDGDLPLLKNVCGGIIVDINGDDEPNVYFKDVFLLRLSETGLAWDAEVVGNEESVEDDD